MTQLCEKASFQHLVTARNCYKIRPDDDDGWGYCLPLCREYSNSQSNPKTRALAAIPGGTIIGPVIEVVNSLDKYGTEVAIQSISNPVNTSCVVITTETDRFVNEIHNQKTDARSNNELLENIQESER